MGKQVYYYKRVLRERIKYEREKKEWSEAWLAQLLAIERDEVIQIENGTRFPNGELLYRIAKIFRLEPYMLFMKPPEPEDDKERIFQELIKRLLIIRRYSYMYNVVVGLIMDLSVYKMHGRGRP